MRKLMLILVILCLALTAPALAATEAIAPAVSTTVLDLGAFTLEIPNDMPGNLAESIEENVPFLSLYANYDPSELFASNMNITWNSGYQDIYAMEPAVLAQYIIDSSITAFAQMGIVVTNATILGADYDEVSGKPAVSIGYSMDMDYSGAGVDLKMTLYTMQAIVSEPEMGTYSFTISVDDAADIEPLGMVIDTLVWNV